MHIKNRFMKIRFLLVLMAVLCSCIILSDSANTLAEDDLNPEHIDKGEYYYSGGKKIPLLRHKMLFAVKLKGKTENGDRLATLMRNNGIIIREAITSYPRHGIHICNINESKGFSHDDIFRESNNIPEVEYVQPVYVFTEENPLIMTEEFVAQFASYVTEEEINTINAANNVEIVKKMDFLSNTYVLRVSNLKNSTTLDIANRYYEMDNVIWSHPDWIRRMEPRSIPNDSLFPNQWHLNNTGQNGGTPDADVDAPQAWDTTTGSDSITVAVIDTGTDIDHEDLAVGTKIVPGRDVVDNDNDPRPGSGESHGTAVAGVAVAAQNNGIGVSGSAPGCKLMAIRLLASGATNSDEAEAFGFASQNGADIINNSWGPPDGFGPAQLPDIVRTAIDTAVNQGRGGKGCVILFAAGNGNESVDIDGYASYDKVIAVGASNDRDQRSGYSDFGLSLDIMAPSDDDFIGQGITTTDRTGSVGYSGTNYTSNFGGTSSASPLAAGVAALILSVNPDLTWKQVYNILIDTADKINPSDAQYNSLGFSTKYGYGRVNADSAVKAALAGGCKPECSIKLTGTAPNQGIDICIENSCNNPKSIELKIWVELQGQKMSIVSAGSDSSFKIPGGFDTCFTLISQGLNISSGTLWGIRLIDPVTGEELCADTVLVP